MMPPLRERLRDLLDDVTLGGDALATSAMALALAVFVVMGFFAAGLHRAVLRWWLA